MRALQVHVYGAISPEGGSSLYFATGTTGLTLGYKTTKRRGAQAAAGTADLDFVGDARGVGNEEYQDILGGNGAHASQLGMLNEINALFSRTNRRWVWQQDGARAHTVNMRTDKGKATRALILQHASGLVDWPVLACDLSPIENVWSLMDVRLWTECQWHDLDSFKRAVVKVWNEITGDLELMKRLCGSFEKRRMACIAAGGDKIKY